MIKLENVTKVYPGGTVAVKDIDLDIAKGEFVFLVGASGSGKSTLIRLMMREEAPTNGDLWVAGKHASDLANWKVPHLRRSIGTVFQDFKLLPTKTVYENVAFAMEVTGKHRSVVRNQVPQVLKLVGLSAKADSLPRQLSGGEQQRVAVARAFVNRPLILLADEPTGNLDPGTSVGIMRILDRINRTGTTVVMATHDHAIVDAMRRRVVQLDRGRISRDESRGIYETREITAVTTESGDVEIVAVATEDGSSPPLVVDAAELSDDAVVASSHESAGSTETVTAGVEAVFEADETEVVGADDELEPTDTPDASGNTDDTDEIEVVS
jgi:cell division transport system ATP-binding protein